MTVFNEKGIATSNAVPRIIVKPFDWNDNLSEKAQEDFSLIQRSLPYGTATTIGMALAKLELLEKQGCKVEPQESDKCSKCKYHTNPDYTRCKECGAERSNK